MNIDVYSEADRDQARIRLQALHAALLAVECTPLWQDAAGLATLVEMTMDAYGIPSDPEACAYALQALADNPPAFGGDPLVPADQVEVSFSENSLKFVTPEGREASLAKDGLLSVDPPRLRASGIIFEPSGYFDAESERPVRTLEDLRVLLNNARRIVDPD
jgi:hypothetical protein